MTTLKVGLNALVQVLCMLPPTPAIDRRVIDPEPVSPPLPDPFLHATAARKPRTTTALPQRVDEAKRAARKREKAARQRQRGR